MFSLHSLTENALVNNDDALINVIKQYSNLKFAKSKKISQDYVLKLVKKRKLLEILMHKSFIMVLVLEPQAQSFCFNVSKLLVGCFIFR